jgi:hypothetical protein
LSEEPFDDLHRDRSGGTDLHCRFREPERSSGAREKLSLSV